MGEEDKRNMAEQGGKCLCEIRRDGMRVAAGLCEKTCMVTKMKSEVR